MQASRSILLHIITIPCDQIRDDRKCTQKKPQLDSRQHLSAKTGPTIIKAMGVSLTYFRWSCSPSTWSRIIHHY